MHETIHATFANAQAAKRAAGALFDLGAREEDLSIVPQEPGEPIDYRIEDMSWATPEFAGSRNSPAFEFAVNAAVDAEADEMLKERDVNRDVAVVLTLVVPSGNVDAGHAWEILDSYGGKPVARAENLKNSYLI